MKTEQEAMAIIADDIKALRAFNAKRDLKLKRAARKALLGETRWISIGRSRNRASVNWQTPVDITSGDSPPVLEGQPYLKTQFKGPGGFSKTLYTPSTFQIVVGAAWKYWE